MHLLFSLILWFGVFFPLSLPATSFVSQPFAKTVRDAPLIVRGTIGMSYTNWGSEAGGQRQIFTYYEFAPSEVFRGQLPGPGGSTLVIREMGGEKDGIGYHVPGTAQFSRGEDVIVLLGDPNPDGSYTVQGMMMGKYDVDSSPNGEELLSGPGITNSPSQDSSAEKTLKRDEAYVPPEGKWTLKAFRELMRIQAEDRVPAQVGSPVSRLHQSSPVPSSGASASQTKSQLTSQIPSQVDSRGDSLGLSDRGGVFGGSWTGWWVGGIAGVGVLAFLIGRNRRS